MLESQEILPEKVFEVGTWSIQKHNKILLRFELLDISFFYFLQIGILFEYKVSSEPIDLNHSRAKIRLSRSLHLNPPSPVTSLTRLYVYVDWLEILGGNMLYVISINIPQLQVRNLKVFYCKRFNEVVLRNGICGEKSSNKRGI